MKTRGSTNCTVYFPYSSATPGTVSLVSQYILPLIPQGILIYVAHMYKVYAPLVAFSITKKYLVLYESATSSPVAPRT